MDMTDDRRPDLSYLGLKTKDFLYQLSVPQLVEEAIKNGEGELADNGALAIDTGKFTGRSPKDKFTVYDSITADTVDWNDVNLKFSEENFNKLYDKVVAHLDARKLYVRDAYACADPEYKLTIRLVNERAYSNLFANNLFLRYAEGESGPEKPEWTILTAPSFEADAAVDGTRQGNFTIVNFSRKVILIGGSGYTGEIKKGIFGVLNFIMPHDRGVLSMHCSANKGERGDTALFFGLSGTGKTTLSADPSRGLIGDDEHGWAERSIFNFEGGCYAKSINLTAEQEPQIFNAVRFGALLENINFKPGTREVDYTNIDKTENIRVAYPLNYIDNAVEPSVGGIPENIFFLTADAFGVLPPISRLDTDQAMFHFISGYTAKVAGTEAGVTEPQVTFSACFGKVFLPLHPLKYAELLAKKMQEHGVKVWLINTGWNGGGYGVGKRIKLAYTRAMINEALNGGLDDVKYFTHEIFGLKSPEHVNGVPDDILNPANTWADLQAYNRKAEELAAAFVKNFSQFGEEANERLKHVFPKIKDAINA